MKKLLLSIALVAVTSVAYSAPFAQCRTLQGHIIVVPGAQCPAGTMWVGWVY